MIEFKESKFYKLLQDFFINNDKETFIQFLAEFYNRTEGIIDKNINQDELIKELRELYIKFNEEGIDENIVREKVNYFLENSVKIKDILAKLVINTSNIENIDSQLDTKMNKTDIISMANMGQDVKEAMTGGSVAVVGNYMINNLNINEGQITPNKFSYKVTIAKTQMDIYERGKYVDDAGNIIEMSGWNIRKIIVPSDCKNFTLNCGSDSILKGVIIKDDVKHSIKNKVLYNKKIIFPGCTILLNEHIGYDDAIKSVDMEFYKKGFINEKDYYLVSGDNYVGNGLIKDNVIDTTNAFYNFGRFKVKVDNNLIYTGVLSAITGFLGCCYDINDTYLGNITKTNNILSLPENTSYIIVNLGVDDVLFSNKKDTITTNTQNYGSCLNKPYNFSNKTALFFGDSITKGYINSSTITDKTYCKIFSDKVGLTHTNKAKGGALFTSGYNEVETINTTIEKTTLNTDFIFIGGGTNDYGLGVPLSTFKNSLEELCQYLQSNYNGEVIFITPINRVAPSNNEQAPLQSYRNAIIEKACKYGFSVVDTSKFAFPSTSSEYSTLVLSDNLHPSEKGYEVYAKCLLTELL